MPWATSMTAVLFTVTRPAELSRPRLMPSALRPVVVTIRLSKLTVGPQFMRMPSALLPDVVTARSLNWTWPEYCA